MSNFDKSQTGFATKEKDALISTVDALSDKTQLLSHQHALSLAEIETLSIENQVAALKIKAQEDDLLKIKLEADNKAKEILILKQDAELKELTLRQQKNIILIISISLVLVSILVIFIVRSLRITKKQKSIIQIQKQVVDEKQKSIISGINAASLIQESILPRKHILDKSLPEYFLMFAPKDIVSGDFYWMKDLGSELLFAVVDCTGHGVPGAFMSLHGYNLLERIVTEKKITRVDAILNELNTAIINTMGDEADVAYVKNGMDMAMIKLNKITNEVEFCGAKNNGYILRNGEVTEIRSDKMSIGHIFPGSFTVKKVQLLSGDMLYLYTDGFKDQKGGKDNRCFLSSRFTELLKEASAFGIERQKDFIESRHREWKANNEQTDDICLVGIKIK